MSKNYSDFVSATEAPLVLTDAQAASWHATTDVVVVGFGGAGVVAALQAVEEGREVIAIDRFSGGGATAFSGGVTYAGGTRFQREAGYADDADNMYHYLSSEESAVSPQTLKRFCQGSNADLEWLAGHGVPFSSALFPEKTTYPPEGSFLYYSGNEKVPAYQARATPMPRGHRAVGKGFTGYVHFEALRDSALRHGVELLQHAPVRRLVMNAQGAVLGVEILVVPESLHAEHQRLYQIINPMRPFAGEKYRKAVEDCAAFERQFAERRLIRATSGVILCTGGYIFNLDMLKRYKPAYARVYRNVMRLGSMGCDGSGIELGRSAGGDADLLDSVYVGRSIAPPSSFLHGIMVNSSGQRFINEDAYNGFLGDAIGGLPDQGKAWLILDARSFGRALKECLFPGRGMYLYTLPSLLNILLGGTRLGWSLKGLAKRCGLNEGRLRKSIEENNRAAVSGSDARGKSPANIRPLTKAPYVAINMDLGNKYTVTLMFSLGGLRVDEDSGAVVDVQGQTIPGLYAAGRAAVGLCSRGYLSGMSLADTVFSGRRAARSAVASTQAESVSTG